MQVALRPAVIEDDERSDEELAAVARDDFDAFALLYTRYAPRIEAYLIARTGGAPEVEDLVAQSFFRVVSALGTYRPERGPFAPWIFTVARNVLRDHLRTVIRRPPLMPITNTMPGTGRGPEDLVLAAEERARVRRAYADLTPDQREALALRYGAELSFAEVGMAMGRSEGAAKMLVQRGLADLRHRLKGRE